jgi:type I restriction enzyme, S subunit
MNDWPMIKVSECIKPVFLPAEKLQTKDYRNSGTYPIIDQGQEPIAGWTDEKAGLIEAPLPVVVFGDHTRILKYVDFPFIRGADGTQIIVPDDRFDVRFFYYSCKALNIESKGYSRHFMILKEQRIPVPSRSEQDYIGKALALVEKTFIDQEQAITQASTLKRAAMRELFSRGLRGEAQKETEIGLVPESWEVARLETLCSIRHGFAFSGKYFRPSGNFILLTPGHFNEEGGFRDQLEKTKYYIGDIPDGYLLQKDDLLVAMTEQKAGLLGSSAIIPEPGKYLHNQRLGLVNIHNSEKLEKKYLYHMFNTTPIRIAISANASGSKVRHTSPTKVLSLSIPLPPTLDEQREIVEILDAIDAKIDLHKRKKALLEELFKSLLHKLMTGEIRVEELDLRALSS